MFTLYLILFAPLDESALHIVYLETPPARFESYVECDAWRNHLILDAMSDGWIISIAACEPDVTI